jgi:DNA-binding LacI/PurR family transcriptional regulator
VRVAAQIGYLADRGLPAVQPLPIPHSRTGAADSLSQFRAASPEVTAVAAFDGDVALRVLAAPRDLGLTEIT